LPHCCSAVAFDHSLVFRKGQRENF